MDYAQLDYDQLMLYFKDFKKEELKAKYHALYCIDNKIKAEGFEWTMAKEIFGLTTPDLKGTSLIGINSKLYMAGLPTKPTISKASEALGRLNHKPH